MKSSPSWLNKLCAHPIAICWVIGACAMNVAAVAFVLRGIGLNSAVADWQTLWPLLLAFVPATLLGYLVGMLFCWPWLRPLCAWHNSLPIHVGDRVLILSGQDEGTTASVYELTTSQGGWKLARLDLGEDRKQKFRDIVEPYLLVKLKPVL